MVRTCQERRSTAAVGGESLRHRFAFTLLLLVSMAGCGSWRVPASSDRILPAPRMSPDSVVVEVAFIVVHPSRNRLESPLWQAADEMRIPGELRQSLWKNGMRIAMLGQQLPREIRERLKQSTNEAQRFQATDNITASQHRFQMRQGQPKRIATMPTAATLSYFTSDGGYHRGEPLQNAQCMFTSQVSPLADGRAQFELLPEIYHGNNSTQLVGKNGAWKFKAERPHITFGELLTQVDLSPGQSLMISCTPEPRALGKHYFVDEHRGHKILLLRLAQAQRNELFQRQ